MTHQPLTKAERESILADCFATGNYVHAIKRLCADLDAAEAERDALRSTHAETNLQWAADLAKANAEREAFRAMAHLLATDNAFAVRTKGGGVGFNILCSDTFAWACADAEAIDMSQAPEVWKLYQDGGWQAVALWVQEKRGGEKFIKPVEEMIERSKAILAERDALKAKLAALVKAADPFACDQGCDAVHHPVKDRHDQRENCPVVARLRAAIAAARGGASRTEPTQ